MNEALPDAPEIPAEEDVAPEGDEAPPPPPTEEQIALAEEPGLWLPDEPSRMVFDGDGFSIVSTGARRGSSACGCPRTTSRCSGW